MLAVALVLVAYWGVWGCGFVFDDQAMVVEHQLVADLGRWREMFSTDLWAGSQFEGWQSGYYRPLVLLDLAADRALFGLRPAAFHLHSLAWHLLTVWLGWALLRRVLPGSAALAGTLVLGLHPASSEAVIWIAARNDVMAMALSLLALWLVVPTQARPVRLIVGALVALAALLSKESAVALPLWLGCLDLAAGSSPREGWRRYAALGCGLAVGVGMRVVAGVGASSASGEAGVMVLLNGLPWFLGTVGASLAGLWPLSVGRHIDWIRFEPLWRVAIGFAFLIVLATAPLLVRAERRRAAAAGFLWGAIAIAPTVFAVSSRALFGDRYVHAGIFGLALWVGAVLGRAAFPIVLALCVPGILMIHARIPDWRSTETLFAATLEDAPNPWVHLVQGNLLRERGRHAEAVPHFVAALDADPPAWNACTLGVRASISAGQLIEARDLAQAALDRGCPPTRQHMGLLAMLDLRLGSVQGARDALLRASGPPDPVGWDRAVEAALARLDGDDARYDAIAATWEQGRALEDDVAWLLAGYDLGGEQ
ncbi:MAG: hypothetical protein H6742_04410 [Alphaproteobacteria bacterium]|nr:hypothetical protein [Alphaproteobacteria bacterium]